jgi:para-aminobenzoate synthetase component 1
VTTPLTLDEIYGVSRALFKLKFQEKFVCFSPERFIAIENNKIITYPMKGTIDASIPHAKELILSDEKELAEHTMIVDLLRNDLNLVSRNVSLEQFRQISEVQTPDKHLYQVSSIISGELEEGWQSRIGNILEQLLPAGSITGTPKKRTVEIIDRIEGYDREWFSGVFGYFDGEKLDSGVMIRFIQKYGDEYIYKSGGGITTLSDEQKEYQEMIDKVYLPTL